VAKAKPPKDAAKKAKKGKKGDAPADPQADRVVRLRAHPRARRHIAAAKGWGGLVGFAVTLWLSLRAGAPGFDALLRALVGGVGLYVVAWTCAIAAWRHIAIAEVRAAQTRLEAAAAKAAEEARAAALIAS
jgi:hypothetical protein